MGPPAIRNASGLAAARSACSGATTYTNVVSNYLSGLATPAGFTPPAASVKFWQAAPGTFVSNGSSCPASDPGLQQVTYTLTTTDGLVTESLSVIVRSP